MNSAKNVNLLNKGQLLSKVKLAGCLEGPLYTGLTVDGLVVKETEYYSTF